MKTPLLAGSSQLAALGLSHLSHDAITDMTTLTLQAATWALNAPHPYYDLRHAVRTRVDDFHRKPNQRKIRKSRRRAGSFPRR